MILSIRGQQTLEGEPDSIELVTEGALTCQGGDRYTLRYMESELTGLKGTATTFEIEPGKMTLLRQGVVNSQMDFQEGRRTLTMYETPYGSLAIGINTRHMKVRMGEDGGEIEVDYTTEINHAVAGENLLQVKVKPRAGQARAIKKSGTDAVPVKVRETI